MGLIEINRHPTRRQLAVFGLAWLVFFFILGLAAANHQSDWIAGVVWTIAGLIPVVGWLLPGFMRLVFVGTCYATLPVGVVLSLALLAAVYYLVLTPVGLLMKLLGNDPMRRRFDRSALTYWVERLPINAIKRYFRQY